MKNKSQTNFHRGPAPARPVDTAALLRQALAFHQAGHLVEAEHAYRNILQIQPKHFDALHLLGVAHHHKGEHDEAVRQIDLALKINPSFAAAHNNRGIALKELNRLDEALACYDRAIALDANFADAQNNRGVALFELKRFSEALAAFDRAVWLKPDYAEACNNRGNTLKELKQYDEALKSFDRAIGLRRDFAVALNNRGGVLKALGRVEDALASYDAAVALNPDDTDAQNNRGMILSDLKRFDEALASFDRALALGLNDAGLYLAKGHALLGLKRFADALESYDKAIELRSDDAAALNHRGIALVELKRLDQALESYDRAIAIRADYFEAHNNRGIANKLLKKFDEALASYDKAVALNPDHAETRNNRGNVLKELKRYDEALACYDGAVALKADYPEAFNNRGLVLNEIRSYDEALRALDKALALRPNFAEAHTNRGVVLNNLDRLDEALKNFDQAIALKPDHAEAFYNRANTLMNLKRFEEAAADCDRALAWKSEQKYVEGIRLNAAMQTCNWNNFERDCAQLATSIADGICASQPLTLLPTSLGPVNERKCAELFVADRAPMAPVPLWRGERYGHDRIRVAYVSGDLREHPVAMLMAGVFEQHDKARFETIAISIGGSPQDRMSERLRGAFDRFIDAREQSDHEIAALLRDLEVDIAVDLNGFTGDGRPSIFAERPAPVQVNYLGYAGTLGRDCWDYILADRFVIPDGALGDYAEQVVHLPGSFMATDDGRKISAQVPSRRDVGLPENGFVFCCFNNSYKITPDVFDVWMRLLKAVEGGVLWLSVSQASAIENLRAEAEKRGVSRERLVFAARVKSNEDHLARLKLADLFLDTLYYNAHTTACDALWAGLPILTCPGRTFASRVAGSLLSAVGMPELITQSLDDYEALALTLAREPARLKSIKEKLAIQREICALFNTARFTRQIEAAYTTMWQRAQQGEKPQCFAVEPQSKRHVISMA